ncbi:hypothetical protein [Alteriqipengyuania sp. 357]
MLLLALFMRFGPDIPFRRMFNEHLVERPLHILLARKRHQYLAVVIGGVMLLLGGEMVLLFGPELVLSYAADLALYIDAVIVAAAGTSWSRTQGLVARYRPRFERNLGGQRKASAATPRSKRTRHAPASLTKANDDDSDRAGTGFVAASQPFAIAA